MILRSLQLEYFKQYGQLDLNFREGLVGIVGRNGAGKSSIFEAVLLCLFGKTLTDKAFYKTSWAPPKTNTILVLEFELNNKVYKVRREFRGTAMAHKAYLYGPEEELIANDATPVSEAIGQLIGLDRDAFMRSVFSGQKELGIISNTRGEERKKMVRRMVGLDKLDKIQQLVREDRNIKKREIQGQEHLLLSKEEKKELLKQLKDLAKVIGRSTKLVEKLESDYRKINAKYLAAKKVFDEQNITYKQYNQLQNDLTKWLETLENLQQRKKELTAEITHLKNDQKTVKTLAPQVEQYQTVKQQIDQLERERQQYERLRQIRLQRESLTDQITKAQSQLEQMDKLAASGQQINEQLVATQHQLKEQQKQLTESENSVAKIQSKMGDIRGRIKERQDQLSTIKTLGKEAQCPTCLQPLMDNYDQTLQRLQEEIRQFEQQQLQQLEKQQTEEKQKVEAVKQRIELKLKEQSGFESQRSVLREQFKQCKIVEKELQTLQKKEQILVQEAKGLANIKFDPKVLQENQERLKALEPAFLESTKLENQLKRLPGLQEQLATFEERIKTGQAGIRTKKAALKALQFSEKDFEKSKAKMDELESEKDTAQQAVTKQNKELAALHQQQTALQRDADNQKRVEQEIGNNRHALEDLELLDKLFSHFKNQMLARVRPTIKDIASQLFEQITRGRYEGIEVDDNFEFHIYENGQSFPIHRFSGGEIDLANLCLRIGISKAIAELSGSEVAMNFLAFDEIFGSQDDERRFEILLALDHLKEQYRQIYIISHIDTIKEHFPNILEVRKGADGSYCEWR